MSVVHIKCIITIIISSMMIDSVCRPLWKTLTNIMSHSIKLSQYSQSNTEYFVIYSLCICANSFIYSYLHQCYHMFDMYATSGMCSPIIKYLYIIPYHVQWDHIQLHTFTFTLNYRMHFRCLDIRLYWSQEDISFHSTVHVRQQQ